MMQIGFFRRHQGDGFLGLRALRRFFRDEFGVTAIEYSILAALVGVVAITVVSKVGIELTQTFDTLAASMSTNVADNPDDDDDDDKKKKKEDDDDDKKKDDHHDRHDDD